MNNLPIIDTYEHPWYQVIDTNHKLIIETNLHEIYFLVRNITTGEFGFMNKNNYSNKPRNNNHLNNNNRDDIIPLHEKNMDILKYTY